MSWGYFAELNVTLPTDALARLLKKKPADVVLAKGWSGLRDDGLEGALGRRLTTRDTFAKTLGWYRREGSLPAVRREETTGETTTLRVLTMLEKSVLDHAFPLVALFHAVRDAGGGGTLRLVSDGTSDCEPGVELTSAGGEITKRRLDPDWELTGRFGAELFAPDEGAAAADTKKPTTKTRRTGRPDAKSSSPKEPGAAGAEGLFERCVAHDGLAWLCAGRSLGEVMALVDGESTESSFGLLRYVHYRRSASTLGPAPAGEAAVRLSLHGRNDALTRVALAIGGDPNESAPPSDDDLARVGETWKACVTALAARFDAKRTESPKRGAANQRLAFRGTVERVGIELEWRRDVSAAGGKIVPSYRVLLGRL